VESRQGLERHDRARPRTGSRVSTMSRIVEIDMRSHVVWQYYIGRASRVTGVQVLKNGNISFSSGSGEGHPKSRGRGWGNKPEMIGGAFEDNRQGN